MADDILWATLAVSDGEALSDDLDLELWVTDAGALYASPTREGETSEDVIGTGSLMLGIVRPASEVGDGDVVTPLGEQNGVSVVRQTIALGIGAVTLTRDRLLGLVWQSQGEAESLAAAVTEDGNGTVIAFSVDRELLDEVELKKTFGRLKGASLTGACLLDLEPPLKVLRGHEYVDAEKGEIEELLTRFVGSEAAGPKETAALPQLPSAPAAEPAAVATLAAPAGPPSPPPSSKGLPKWLLPAAAGAVIVGLAVALILVL